MDFDPTSFEEDENNEYDGPANEWASALLQNEDSDIASSFEHPPTKDAVLFIIDCQKLLFRETENPDTKKRTSQWKECCEAICEFMKSKIVSNQADLVEVLLFNTNKTSNVLNIPGAISITGMRTINADDIVNINNISKFNELQFSTEYGFNISPSPTSSLPNIFWLATHIFSSKAPKQQYLARAFLFTNQDNPCPEEALRKTAIQRALDLQGLCSLELFGLNEVPEKPFDVRPFYMACLGLDDETVKEYMKYSNVQLQDIKKKVRMKKHPMRILSRLFLEVSDKLSVGVAIYSNVQKARLPVPIRLSPDDNTALKSETAWVCPSTQKKIMPEQMKHIYPIGATQVMLSKEEREQLVASKKAGFSIVAFKNEEDLKINLNVSHSLALYPADDMARGSSDFISTLIVSLVKRKKMAIVRFSPRKNSVTRYAALVAVSNAERENEYLAIVPLPWVNDVRNPSVSQCIPTEDYSEPTAKCKEYIKSIGIKSFTDGMFSNPSILSFYNKLEALALNQEDAEIEDIKLEMNLALQERSAAFLDQWVDSLPVMEETTVRTRKTPAKSLNAEPSAKKPKISGAEENSLLSIDDIRKLYTSNTLGKLTVDKLKNFLRSHDLPVKGNKPDLIAAVEKFLNQ